MPRQDGTGPLGAGSATGRGLGPCTGVNAFGYGTGNRYANGRGYGRGLRRAVTLNPNRTVTQKELLREQRRALINRLNIIDKQLEQI
ncbi:MAG: DUF5320 domain-containing protein [Eubacteriales bacterium]|nr:DUF5320 domain-containing protein [Eubacteriales bacterium]